MDIKKNMDIKKTSGLDITYTVDDVFEIAEQIERNGAGFYRKAAGIVTNDLVRDFLSALADDEDRHEKTFAEMRSKLTDRGQKLTPHDRDDVVTLFLQIIAGGYVFNIKEQPANLLSGSESITEICKIAIEKEKDSIVFYTGIREHVKEESDKARIDTIIREEQGHLVSLGDQGIQNQTRK